MVLSTSKENIHHGRLALVNIHGEFGAIERLNSLRALTPLP